MASISRILSNIWIREVASTISGRVLSIGSGTDADGQGSFYRSYFNKCSLYLTSEVSPASGCDLVLDVQNMSAIADSYFDCVFCSGVLEHVREPDVAIGEITRILKVGGFLLLGVPFRQSIHLPPTDYWRFTEYGFKHLLQKHGYAIEAVKAIDAEDPMFPASYWVSAKKKVASGLKVSTGHECISTFFDQTSLGNNVGGTGRSVHETPASLAKPLMEFLPGQSINLVIADEGWILEQCARAIEQHTLGVKISRHPDPSAAINYYINYYAYQGPQPGIDIAFFTHVEERVPSAAERFFQVAREVDVCVCMSTFYADMLQAQGIRNILVIKPGVDLELFRPVVRIGVVGRTYPTGRKGEALLKQVMDEPGIEWHFTGEGWPGPSKHYAADQMPNFYNAMDYILVPSYYEGGPMSVLEALACGKEVIAPAVGFVPDYPHIEYAAGDAEDLRRILKVVVAKRSALRNSVAACSWENWAKHHLELFRDVLAGKKDAAELLQQFSSVKGSSRESAAVNPAPSQQRRLEIGSGMNPHPGYEHMDIRADLPHIEHVHDIYKPLPFAAGTFDEILSWSVVEHISWRNIKEVLTNWKKVLRPGGKLEIWVPDLEYLCTMYKEGNVDEHLDKSYIEAAQKVIGHYSPSVWAMIKMFGGQDYQENFHAAMYDWPTMQQMLTFIGFQQVERIAPYHGLHVIAFKPYTEL